MYKKIILIVLVLLYFNEVNSQIKRNKHESLILKNGNNLPLKTQAKMLKDFLQQYNSGSFKYNDDIRKGKLDIDVKQTNKDSYSIIIIDNTQKRIVEEIKLLKKKNNDGNEVLEFNQYILDRLFVTTKNKSLLLDGVSYINILVQDSILWDKVIISDPGLPTQYWTKILNKSYTMSYLEDQNGNPSVLFKQCVAGKIIPYNGGTNSKLLTIDNQFHSVIFFDASFSPDVNSSLNGVYGYAGTSAGEFHNPTGIALGRAEDELFYPVYISDFYNNRIVKVNYIIDPSSNGVGSFDEDSFEIFKSVLSPTDVMYFQSSDTVSDKIWVSLQEPVHSSIVIYNKYGFEISKIIGYQSDTSGTIYYFNAGVEIKMNYYSQGFSSVAIIDKERNYLATCLVDEDGIPNLEITDDGYVIVASSVLSFPSNEHINSIAFHKTSSASSLWPYIWVTSPNYVHLFKINNSAYVQYLASTSQPYNSNTTFTGMLNTSLADNYFDILTIESWNSSRGIRKYWPFCDIYADSLTSYCVDSLDEVRFKATFTNDCWLRLYPKRKNINGNWEGIKIKKINGTPVNDTVYIKWQLAGNNQASSDLYVDIKLDLPIEDYALGGDVKLIIQMYPEYYNPEFYSNMEHITKEYTTEIKKVCLPRAGGCPFIYYKGENGDYFSDNNILHKSEYSGSIDITDKYKLINQPLISGNKLQMAFVENESDNSNINMVKLYAIDYPSNRRMAITEANYIVLYDSSNVVSADTVLLNGSTNITSNVNFHNPGTPVNRYKLDSIYAHFSYSSAMPIIKKNKDTPNINGETKTKLKNKEYHNEIKGSGGLQPPHAFIANVGNLLYPIASVKDTGGVIMATSIYSNSAAGLFGRRENSSLVVIPLFYDSNKVRNLQIKWQSDFHLKSIGIVELDYSNFYVNEAPLDKSYFITAELDSEITSSVTTIDSNYGLLSSTNIIKFNFDLSGLPSIPNRHLRTYVVEVNGHYSTSSDRFDIKPENFIPTSYSLSQNYPNPFNPSTKINYDLPRNSKVMLVIYDILGQEVMRLVNNEFKLAGRYTVEFNGLNYASGVYFYRIEAGNFVQSKKMVLIK